MCGVVMEEGRVDDDSSGLGGGGTGDFSPGSGFLFKIIAGKNLVGECATPFTDKSLI